MSLTTYITSLLESGNTKFYLARHETNQKVVCIEGDATIFEVAKQVGAINFCPLNAHNAAALRAKFSWLAPAPLGLKTSAGTGDRLGKATPGHILAVRGSGVAPIFAQQSVRENSRTKRTPQQVIDDAMWGVMQMGWREAWGADADHLKTTEDADSFVAAGYSFFTVDPGEHVDNAAQTDSLDTLKQKVNALDWNLLNDSVADLRQRYIGKTFNLNVVRQDAILPNNDLKLTFDEMTLLRAAAKYGRSVAHAVTMYRHIAKLKNGTFDFEVSVDETELPTSIEEHFYIANELKRLGVKATSLAPRFVGRFEKGVDYIGDLNALDENLKQHSAIARYFNYKISLHSGSDKFTVYPIAVKYTQGLVHLKTAGTSYLEALRVIASVSPQLFKTILDFSRERYTTDSATYHVSADLVKVPASAALADSALSSLLDQFDARQVLHVTYGSVLAQFGDQLHATLAKNEELFTEYIRKHFVKHIQPFAVNK